MADGGEASGLVRVWLCLCGLMLLISAPIAGLVMYRFNREALASQSWPTVEGKVIQATVNEHVGIARRYSPRVEYKYQVQGKSYIGRRYQVINWEADKSWLAEEAVRGLKAGKPVTVHYNPENPAQAVLKPGLLRQQYTIVAIPFVMFLFGLILLFMTFIGERRR
jgi:uncharacterized protein DUF3592